MIKGYDLIVFGVYQTTPSPALMQYIQSTRLGPTMCMVTLMKITKFKIWQDIKGSVMLYSVLIIQNRN